MTLEAHRFSVDRAGYGKAFIRRGLPGRVHTRKHLGKALAEKPAQIPFKGWQGRGKIPQGVRGWYGDLGLLMSPASPPESPGTVGALLLLCGEGVVWLSAEHEQGDAAR